VSAREHQLYALSRKGYEAPFCVDLDGKLQTRSASDLPLLQWPDGSWCHPANRFIWELFEKGLSRRNRGGSIAVASAHISRLLRYCWKRRTDPIELTDNQFREFVGELNDEMHPERPGQRMRTSNAVIAIGRTCLSFLDSVGQYHCAAGFVDPHGQIRATKEEHTFVDKPGQKRTVVFWNHPALPGPSTMKKRLPIATANIERIRDAIARVSPTQHQRLRRYVMLKLLEVTPSRRGEVALITLKSVLDASRMPMPMLEVPTIKKRGGQTEYRFIPISRADIRFLCQYAEIHRRGVIRRKLKGHDHGVFLLNGRTGEPLRPNTITQEIKHLAKAAGIIGVACPHMFRHRFITRLFVALIEQYQIENVDSFRRMLMEGEEFKRKVAEWTGHSSLASLDVYIHLAFDEVGSYKKVYNLSAANLAIDSFLGSMKVEIAQFEKDESWTESSHRLLALAEALKADLVAAKAVENTF